MQRKLATLSGHVFGRDLRAAVNKSKVNAQLNAQSGELQLEIYGDIGQSLWGDGITAQQVSEAVKIAEVSSVRVRINSPGGDAFEGVAIYNVLKSCGKPVHVVVDGLAASAASIIAMAGDTVSMGEGTVMMIHAAMVLAYGNSVDMRETAAILETVTGSMADIYAARTGKDKTDILQLLYAETWLNAQEAVDAGFADDVTGGTTSKAGDVAASYNLAVFAKAPDALKTFGKAATPIADVASREIELYGLKKGCV